MRTTCTRISVIPILLASLLLASSLAPAPTSAGTGPGNGEPPPPSDQNRSNVIIGVAVVLAAVGVVWWLTRGKGEPEEEKSDATLEPTPKSSTDHLARETKPAKLSP